MSRTGFGAVLRRAASLSLAAACAAGAMPVAAADADAAALARVVEVARGAGVAGEAALLGTDGSVHDAAFGLADREHLRPHRVGQRWLWASVTKQVTATLLLQQVEAGRLGLESPIGALWPALARDPNATLPLRALLQHRSGLPNPDQTPSEAGQLPAFYRQSGPAIADAARAAGDCLRGSKPPPAEGFNYNNCDYLVATAILERASGQRYDALVRERIAGPFGLASLRVAADGEGNSDVVGYDGAARFPSLNVATFGGAGALVGSARDLAGFDRALLEQKIVAQPSLDALWRGDPQLGYQALGVWSYRVPLRGCAAPLAIVERRGDVGGTQVRNVIVPDSRRAFVFFTNDAGVDFGEVWQGRGLAYELFSAALCAAG